jgi:DNA-binding beta-propeller fold protein YncE
MIKTIQRISLALLVLSASASFGQQTDVPAFLSPELTFIWESENTLEIPESVFFDTEHECIYVSNINGVSNEEDGNGYLSKLNLQGEIISHKWVTGLHAPKGMAKYGNYLFVSDINQLLVIDITKSEIVKKYPAPEAIFLNDVSINPKTGTVYVSDSHDSKIYRLKGGHFALWLSDERLDRVNGLCYQNNHLYAGVSNAILSIHPCSQDIQSVVENTGSIDGLLYAGKDTWITSDWAGNIQIIESGKIKKVLSSADQKINAADLGYMPEEKIILVPTFRNNRVIAYQLK